MHSYCPECYSKLSEKGIVFPLYSLICENYLIHGVPLAVWEDWWMQPLRYLEINDYIITTEGSNDIVFAQPVIVALDDDQSFICCSGNCEFSTIDFDD